MSAAYLQSKNPVAIALHHAALTSATAVDPDRLDFESELDSRLLMVRSVVNLMAEATGAADGYGDRISMEGLHGLARLIGNELTTISILHESLQRVLNADLRGEVQS